MVRENVLLPIRTFMKESGKRTYLREKENIHIGIPRLPKKNKSKDMKVSGRKA